MRKGLLHTNTHTLGTKNQCKTTNFSPWPPDSHPPTRGWNPPSVEWGRWEGGGAPPTPTRFDSCGWGTTLLTDAMSSILQTLPSHISHTCESPDTANPLHMCPITRVITHRSHPHSHTCDTPVMHQTSRMNTANKHTSTLAMSFPNTMCQIAFTKEIPKAR